MLLLRFTANVRAPSQTFAGHNSVDRDDSDGLSDFGIANQSKLSKRHPLEKTVHRDNMKYDVQVREVHVQHMIVEAGSPEEAVKKVRDGDGDQADIEYSHTLEPDTWTVESLDRESAGDE